MTPAQRDAILKVIDEDAEVMSQLCSSTGLMCITGGLAHAAGIPKDQLRTHLYLYMSEIKAVELVFGIGYSKLDTLLGINDNYTDRSERQAALRKKVEAWEASDAV